MLDAISAQGGPGVFRSPTISAEQGAQLSELLSNYDADNLSTSDAESIVSQIRELGIRPGRELVAAVKEEGFDLRDIAEKAGIKRPGPAREEHVRPLNGLTEILADYDLDNLSKEDRTELRTRIQEAGFGPNRNAVDIRV